MAFLEFKGDLRVKLDELSADPEMAVKVFLERLRVELLRDMLDLNVVNRIRKSGAKAIKIDFAIGPAD